MDIDTGKPATLNLYFSNHTVAHSIDLASLDMRMGLDIIELSAPIVETALPYMFVIKEITKSTAFEDISEVR